MVFESSFVKVADKQWEFVPERRISLLNDAWNTILFEGIELRNNGQRISIEGALADSAAQKQLHVDIEGFNLDFLDPILGKDIEGDLSAQVVLRDVYQQILFDGDINVEGFAIDGFFFGDISAKAVWDALQKKYASMPVCIAVWIMYSLPKVIIRLLHRRSTFCWIFVIWN
ncbi:MAG: hypothetical protein HC912_10195 [Saprospiraceae bacterium]|nr:hypothetical protein [Saprospiraceae bacterium]